MEMKVFFQVLFVVTLVACGNKNQTSDKNIQLTAKLKQLEALKSQLSQINDKIASTEAEIIQLDPSRGQSAKLVTTQSIAPEGFQHFIDLQGQISSTNISYVAPRNGVGGYVKHIYVKAGDRVKKGQLLLKLDDQILKQSIEAVKTQLTMAKSIYERTQNLWNQGIGSEVQLLSSKTNMETLENQIKTQEEQLKTYWVYADQNGIADIVNIKVGEMFTGMSALGPQIQIVNNSDLSVNVDIPENYTGQIQKGAQVIVEVPALNKSIKSTIFRLSNSINVSSRGYTAEIKIPSIENIKPNMAAYVKILNHTNSKAIVVPINIVQSDDNGKFVFIMKKDGDNFVASRKPVQLGQLYGDSIEILSGLVPGDEIITVGYQGLYEGQLIRSTGNDADKMLSKQDNIR